MARADDNGRERAVADLLEDQPAPLGLLRDGRVAWLNAAGRALLGRVIGLPLEALAAELLTLQGSGDRDGAGELLAYGATLRPDLAADLERLAAAGLPERLAFRQGPALLGL